MPCFIFLCYGIMKNLIDIQETYELRESSFYEENRIDDKMSQNDNTQNDNDNSFFPPIDECKFKCENAAEIPFLLTSGAGSVVGPKFCWNGTNMMSSKVS